MNPLPAQGHGARPARSSRKRKSVADYAEEYKSDFTARSFLKNDAQGQKIEVLVCRFCSKSIGARSDRIQEHLSSKSHLKQKRAYLQAQIGKGQAAVPLPEPELPSALSSFYIHQNPEVIDISSPSSSPSPSSSSENSGAPNNGLFQQGNLVRNCAAAAATSGFPSSAFPQQQPQQENVIKWTNFNSNLASAFQKFYEKDLFVDAVLCAEGKSIRCHKAILAASSPWFEELFSSGPMMKENSAIFLNNVRFWEAEALVEFMYMGQVSVPSCRLQSLFQAGANLRIKGFYGQQLPNFIQGIKQERFNSNNNDSSFSIKREEGEPSVAVRIQRQQLPPLFHIGSSQLQQQQQHGNERQPMQRANLNSRMMQGRRLFGSSAAAALTIPKEEFILPTLPGGGVASAEGRGTTGGNVQQLGIDLPNGNLQNPNGVTELRQSARIRQNREATFEQTNFMHMNGGNVKREVFQIDNNNQNNQNGGQRMYFGGVAQNGEDIKVFDFPQNYVNVQNRYLNNPSG